MQDDIQIPYALKNGEWVHISQVERGLSPDCVCPCCEGALVAKKGDVMAHHFAHIGNTNCSPETVLHFIAKHFIYEKVKELLKAHIALSLSWGCSRCHKKHEFNFLQNATSVQLEYSLGTCRPDVAILTHGDVALAVIEIVVTHKPDERALTYYRQEDIGVIEIEVRDAADLERIQSSRSIDATRIGHCISQKCKICSNPLIEGEERLVIAITSCRRCNSRMKACFIRSDSYVFYGPQEFTDWQVQAARHNGVLLEKHFSVTLGIEYLANTCPKCRKWIGEHYLPSIVPNKYSKDAEWEEYLVGYRCTSCSSSVPCNEKLVSHMRCSNAKTENQPELFS